MYMDNQCISLKYYFAFKVTSLTLWYYELFWWNIEKLSKGGGI